MINPLENSFIDGNGDFVAGASQQQSDDTIFKATDSHDAVNRDYLNKLYDEGKFHAFACAILDYIGIAAKLESLQDVDKKYSGLRAATDEIYLICGEMGILDKMGVLDVATFKRIINLWHGLSPMLVATVREIKSKKQSKGVDGIRNDDIVDQQYNAGRHNHDDIVKNHQNNYATNNNNSVFAP